MRIYSAGKMGDTTWCMFRAGPFRDSRPRRRSAGHLGFECIRERTWKAVASELLTMYRRLPLALHALHLQDHADHASAHAPGRTRRAGF